LFDFTGEAATSFLGYENRIVSVGLNSKHYQLAFELKNRFYSKIFTQSSNSLLVIGGQSEPF
jgi:hypothetical protein